MEVLDRVNVAGRRFFHRNRDIWFIDVRNRLNRTVLVCQNRQSHLQIGIAEIDRLRSFLSDRHRRDHQIDFSRFQGRNQTVEGNIFKPDRPLKVFSHRFSHFDADTGRLPASVQHLERRKTHLHSNHELLLLGIRYSNAKERDREAPNE